MSTYFTRFALIGAGEIGNPIVASLAAVKGVSVLVLTRIGSSQPKAQIPAGVATATIDYTDVSSVASVLKEHNIEAVLSTVGPLGVASQKSLADAAKLAGVQLFSPSEYGFPTTQKVEGALGAKKIVADYITSIGLPSVRFFTGLFIEFIPWLTLLTETGKFHIVGDGNVPGSFTSKADIAGFVAHVLTQTPVAELTKGASIYRIEGESASLNEVAAKFRHLEVVHVDVLPDGEGAVFKRLIQTVFVSKGASVFSDLDAESAKTSNGLWEGHKWLKIKDVLAL